MSQYLLKNIDLGDIYFLDVNAYVVIDDYNNVRVINQAMTY